jgi:hypothetical protein
MKIKNWFYFFYKLDKICIFILKTLFFIEIRTFGKKTGTDKHKADAANIYLHKEDWKKFKILNLSYLF